MPKNRFKPNTTILDRDGTFIDWKVQFKQKNNYLETYCREETPLDFVKAVYPKEYLDTYMSKEEAGMASVLGLPVHTGRSTGLVKYTVNTSANGKHNMHSFPLYDDYNAIELYICV